jgi:hypothetical protein
MVYTVVFSFGKIATPEAVVLFFALKMRKVQGKTPQHLGT